MAQFILDAGTELTHGLFDRLPDIAQGYIEAACFCGVWNEENSDFQPALSDFDNAALAGLAGHAIRFAHAYAQLLNKACACPGYDMLQAGRDLWLSSNGHGAGFFDRDLGGLESELDSYAQNWEAVELYVTDCGKVDTCTRLQPYEESDLKAALPQVGGRYGAPMGRNAYHAEPFAILTARHISLDAGGYDAGGAYWGLGQPLWRVECDGLPASYIRAETSSQAIKQAAEGVTCKPM